MRKHLLAALLTEGVEAPAAQLLQRVALCVAQLFAADQAVGAVAVGGDAVEGEPCPPSAAQDPALGRGWLLPGKSVAQQLHEHEGLVDVAHAHAFGDVRAQAKKGSRGAVGHGVMRAAAGRPGQVWFWAARQAVAPAGIPSGVIAWRLQPTRLLVWLCRLSPYPTPRPQAAAACWRGSSPEWSHGCPFDPGNLPLPAAPGRP